MITYLLQGLALGVSAAASPGPFQAYLINRSLVSGWQRGVLIAFAPLISDGPIVLLIILILDQIPPWFIRVLSLAGGLFVLYLAVATLRQLRRAPASLAEEPAKPSLTRGGLWQGVIVNTLSPGLYTFWAFVNGPILINAWQQSWKMGLSFLVGFYLMLVSTSIGIAVLFAQAKRLGQGVVRGLSYASILILFIFGLLLLGRATLG